MEKKGGRRKQDELMKMQRERKKRDTESSESEKICRLRDKCELNQSFTMARETEVLSEDMTGQRMTASAMSFFLLVR